MRILITKDGSSKIARDVTSLEEARHIAMQFHVELLDDEGNAHPLPAEQPPADDAHVAVGSTRFSDGELQTEETLAAAQAAPAPAAKKAAPAKKVAAKKAKR